MYHFSFFFTYKANEKLNVIITVFLSNAKTNSSRQVCLNVIAEFMKTVSVCVCGGGGGVINNEVRMHIVMFYLALHSQLDFYIVPITVISYHNRMFVEYKL